MLDGVEFTPGMDVLLLCMALWWWWLIESNWFVVDQFARDQCQIECLAT